MIGGIIQQQKFELIRNKIAEILAVEIANQYTLSQLSYLLDLKVWTERIIAFDSVDLPCINVSFSDGNYDGQTAITTDGSYNYNIDIYTSATVGNEADALAMIKLQRIMGICRVILEYPTYNTLTFVKPYIFRSKVASLSIANPNDKNTENVVMGRLVLAVKAPETNELNSFGACSEISTTVKLHDTEKGYYWLDEFQYILQTNNY